MSGGAIRRKQKKSLEKSILLREFITDTKPGRPVALMVCTCFLLGACGLHVWADVAIAPVDRLAASQP